MAVAFRSDAEVTNGTAGTLVTVAKPSGIVDTGSNPGRDHLVAYIASVGAPSITPPAGWTLVTSAVDAGNAVTLWCYRKMASSEGASWTWTLGASQRNWGWVGAYTGVNHDAPIGDTGTDLTLTTSTTLLPNVDALPMAGMAVAAGAAVRTASGTATTWTVLDDAVGDTATERADLSTNAGSSTDVAGTVVDGDGEVSFESVVFIAQLVASQSQTAGVGVAIALAPYFVPYTGDVNGHGLVVEAAFGADPDALTQDDWTWTDITTYVHNPAQLSIRHGRSNRSLVPDPSQMRFTLLNLAGEFTSPAGTYTAQFVRNLPIRVRLNGFGVDVAGLGYHRATMFLSSATPRWDQSANFAVVDVVADGRLRRLQQQDVPLPSPGQFSILSPLVGDPPVGYWPFEDGSNSTTAASALAGGTAATVFDMTFAADSTVAGSLPLPRLSATSEARAPLPISVTSTETSFLLTCLMTFDAAPAATTIVALVHTTGTAAEWQIAAEAPNLLHVRAYDANNTLILDNSNVVTGMFDGHNVWGLSCTQDGADVDYTVAVYAFQDSLDSVSGSGFSATLTSQTHGRVTRWRVPPDSNLDGATFGHLAIYGDPLPTSALFSASALIDANKDETPHTRFARLASENNLPSRRDTDSTETIEMGQQPINTTAVELLRECTDARLMPLFDSGLVGDHGGVLWLPSRTDLLNRDATLTIDGSQGQVRFIRPTLDDQDIINDLELSRTDGSTVRHVDDDSIAAEGRYRSRASLNLNADTPLDGLAAWMVHLTTVGGYRFPGVAWDMRRSHTLAEEWMACRLLHRIDVSDPPSQYPPDTIAALLEGYTETLSAETWTVEANLSSFAPYFVFEIEDPVHGRLDTSGSALALGVDSDDTSLVVATDSGKAVWINSSDRPQDFDFNIVVGGEVMTVTDITGSTSPQAFSVTRSVNGVVKSHSAGADVRIARLAVA